MRQRKKVIFFAAGIFLLLVAFTLDVPAVASSQDFLIAENGQARATIVVPADASGELGLAVRHMRNYIRRSCGVNLPLETDQWTMVGNIIAIGENKFNPDDKLGFSRLKPGGFRIKTDGNVLSIVGSDDAGTEFGIYEFLEKFVGIRWLWPGDIGEVIPKHDKIEIESVDITEEPDFIWRDRGPGGALWGAHTGPTEMHERELLLGITKKHQSQVQLWERRNKWGGMKIYGGHCLGEVFAPEKYAETHPEYYALVDGKRDVPGEDYDYKHGCQICTSNPEVIKVAAEWAGDFFDKHPDYDGVHMTLNDGGGFCECPNCLALDSNAVGDESGIDAEEMKKRPSRRSVITDRVYTYLNQVTELLQKTHPGKYVVSMAYSRYIEPPKKVKPDKYLIPQYCLWSAYAHANAEEKAKHERIAAGWAKVSNKMGIYEYFINGSWPGLHRLAPYRFAESIKWLYAHGITLYQTQSGDEFGINGLNYYVAGKLLWDTSLDVNDVLDDFYGAGFGKAAPVIKRFHKRFIDAWDREIVKDKAVACYSIKDTRLPDYLTPRLFEQSYADLAEAEKMADDDEIKQRIEFYRKGLRFSELTANAVAATRKIVDKIYKDKADAFGLIHFLADKDNKKLVEEALAAWAERDAYAEELKNDFVLGYFWVRYNNDTRTRFYVVSELENMLKLFETEGLEVKSDH